MSYDTVILVSMGLCLVVSAFVTYLGCLLQYKDTEADFINSKGVPVDFEVVIKRLDSAYKQWRYGCNERIAEIIHSEQVRLGR